MAASMPVRRPRRKSGAVTSCPKDTEGAELHKRSAEASGFDRTARLGRTGHKERTPWKASGRERTMSERNHSKTCALRSLTVRGRVHGMADGLTSRIRHLWITLLHPAWAWLFLVLGLVSLLTWVRDEFLSPELQEKLKIVKFLPNWDLSAWLLAFAVTLLVVLFEGSYRAARSLEKQRDDFKDTLEAIERTRPLTYANAAFNFLEPQWQTGEVFITGWALLLENLGDQMLKYTVKELYLEHDGKRAEHILATNEGAYIHARKEMQHSSVPAEKFSIGKPPTNFIVGFVIEYDNVPPVRVRTTMRRIKFDLASIRPVAISNVILDQNEY